MVSKVKAVGFGLVVAAYVSTFQPGSAEGAEGDQQIFDSLAITAMLNFDRVSGQYYYRKSVGGLVCDQRKVNVSVLQPIAMADAISRGPAFPVTNAPLPISAGGGEIPQQPVPNQPIPVRQIPLQPALETICTLTADALVDPLAIYQALNVNVQAYVKEGRFISAKSAGWLGCQRTLSVQNQGAGAAATLSFSCSNY